MIKTSGMELNELHVGDIASGTPGHSHPVAGSNFRICGIAINPSASACTENYPVRAKGYDFSALFVENINPETTGRGREAKFCRSDKIDGKMAFENIDPVRFANGIQEFGFDLSAGSVFMMEYPPF